ncbi:hypothetical protein [Dokdonella sp.]|uniref:hypothetical protein n=2 Tax=Dokdonella sp. TaxID=2291710 RepID=UPI003783A351
MSSHAFKCLALACGLLAGSSSAVADSVVIPHTFSANTPARAAEVNDNFSAVASAVNDNAADIGVSSGLIADQAAQILALQSALADQQAAIDVLTASVATLATQLSAIQNSSVMALASNLELIQVPDPNQAGVEYLTAEFHGINIRIVNGQGSTASANGLGNLTVGYNETDANAAEVCSDGAQETQPNCVNFGGSWARNHRSGSHNLIVGSGNAYSQYGGLLAGNRNAVTRAYATVSGGRDNLARGENAIVAGGNSNTASSRYTTVAGGGYNRAIVIGASVAGGYTNSSAANYANVSGGFGNTATGNYATVGGGRERSASGDYDWRAGTLFENQ